MFIVIRTVCIDAVYPYIRREPRRCLPWQRREMACADMHGLPKRPEDPRKRCVPSVPEL